jgi:hypothetical protein
MQRESIPQYSLETQYVSPAERCCGIVGILTMKHAFGNNASLRFKHICEFIGRSIPIIRWLAEKFAAPNPLLLKRE